MKKILLVDDAELVLFMEKILLESVNYELNSAGSGEEALEKIGSSKDRPDLVLLDVNMPGMDGIEVCRRIKANPQTKDISVLMVTVNADPSDIDKAKDAGCNGYCTKPLSRDQLLTKVKDLLNE